MTFKHKCTAKLETDLPISAHFLIPRKQAGWIRWKTQITNLGFKQFFDLLTYPIRYVWNAG